VVTALAAQESVRNRVSQKLNRLLFHFPQMRPSLSVLLPDAGRLVSRWLLHYRATITLRRKSGKTFAILQVKGLGFPKGIEDHQGLFHIVPAPDQFIDDCLLPCEMNLTPGDMPLGLREMLPQHVLIHGADRSIGVMRGVWEHGPHSLSEPVRPIARPQELIIATGFRIVDLSQCRWRFVAIRPMRTGASCSPFGSGSKVSVPGTCVDHWRPKNLSLARSLLALGRPARHLPF